VCRSPSLFPKTSNLVHHGQAGPLGNSQCCGRVLVIARWVKERGSVFTYKAIKAHDLLLLRGIWYPIVAIHCGQSVVRHVLYHLESHPRGRERKAHTRRGHWLHSGRALCLENGARSESVTTWRMWQGVAENMQWTQDRCRRRSPTCPPLELRDGGDLDLTFNKASQIANAEIEGTDVWKTGQRPLRTCEISEGHANLRFKDGDPIPLATGR
jgi:hypothetical protein